MRPCKHCGFVAARFSDNDCPARPGPIRRVAGRIAGRIRRLLQNVRIVFNIMFGD
jgi:hypothetical protein